MVDERDVLFAVSSSAGSAVTVELAEMAKNEGLGVIAVTAVDQSRRITSHAASGPRLFEVADIVLDTCTPLGDGVVDIDGVVGPVGPTSTVAGAALANAVKCRLAELLAHRGQPPAVLVNAVVADPATSARSFDDAYDEHARRVSRLYQR